MPSSSSMGFGLLGKRTLFAYLDDMTQKIDQQDLNLRRANSFNSFVKEQVSMNGLGLKPISSATEQIHGPHDPLSRTGTLMDGMEVRKSGTKGASAGFHARSKKYPKSDLTYTQIAILQHTGFRIPLRDDVSKTSGGGTRVRKFLGAHGIYPSQKSIDRGWLEVPARPFLSNGIARYVQSGEDQMVIHEFLNEVL